VKTFRVRYTTEASARIRKLHPQIKREIREAIRELLSAPLLGHPLQLDLSGYWSHRVRTHRIIYRINDDNTTLDSVFVGPRRSVYEQLRALLMERRQN
jgi:mRNA-degrading endonuclease RelE of RelBE toxin-antitoxin system